MAARLTISEKNYLVKLMTLGEYNSNIQTKFNDLYGHPVSEVTLARLRKANLDAIEQARSVIASSAASSAALIKQKSHQLIESKLDDAIEDTDQLRKLRRQFQDGELTEEAYKAKRKLYSELTINELTKISENMHNQAKSEDDDGTSPADQAALAALIAGIQSGNPVQLIQVVAPQSQPA